MTKRIAMLLLVTIALTHSAMAKGRPLADIPVTQDIADEDGNFVPYYLQSDGLGAYQNGLNGDKSVLMENGFNGLKYADRLLDLNELNVARNVRITFIQGTNGNEVLPGDPGYIVPAAPPQWGTVYTPTRMMNQCSSFNNSGFLPMSAGDTIHCPMLISVEPTDGTNNHYRLAMGFNDRPETQKVQITCNAADSAGCNDWVIDPIPNPDGTAGKTRARLEYVSTTKGKTILTNKGAFYLTFHMHVTRP